MNRLALVAAVLCGMGFISLCALHLFRRSPELVGRLSTRLQFRGRKLLDLSEFQAQHALAFASSHVAVVILGAALVWAVSSSLVAAVATAALLYILPARWFAWQRERRRRQIEAELPDALLFIASALRAGSALSVALQVLVRDQTGPLGQEFGTVLKEQRLGVTFDDAIQKMAQRIQIQDFVLVVVALRVSKEVGGNLSEPLQVLAETLRRKAILEGRIKALTAQGRIQGIVMTLFPVFLAAVLYFMQPSMSLLFTTTIGWVVLVVIGVMLFLGYMMIRKIIAIDI
ncbi:type II secretion system F family protein [Xenophilus aerolatus]|nr:type II secretion system F family protein [Xenophilus aerolatus]